MPSEPCRARIPSVRRAANVARSRMLQIKPTACDGPSGAASAARRGRRAPTSGAESRGAWPAVDCSADRSASLLPPRLPSPRAGRCCASLGADEGVRAQIRCDGSVSRRAKTTPQDVAGPSSVEAGASRRQPERRGRGPSMVPLGDNWAKTGVDLPRSRPVDELVRRPETGATVPPLAPPHHRSGPFRHRVQGSIFRIRPAFGSARLVLFHRCGLHCGRSLGWGGVQAGGRR
jgi:hypothetical protein